jgi:hypothetical protein
MGIEPKGSAEEVGAEGTLLLEVPPGAAALILEPDGAAKSIIPTVESGPIPDHSECIGLFLWILANDDLRETLLKEFRIARATLKNNEGLQEIEEAMLGVTPVPSGSVN